MKQKTITLKVSDKTKDMMIEFFEDLKRENQSVADNSGLSIH